MDVSVVVPLFNVKDYIEICIQALLNQDYPQDRYEIIMVDNNSTDGTSEIASRFSRIRLLSEPKQGAYAARNQGIAVSEGEVVAFTDPDCQPHLDWLSCIMNNMRQPGRGIILGRREFGSKSWGLSMMADYESAKADYVFSSGVKGIYYGHTNNMAVLKSLFEKLGNFMEIDRGADTVFVRRAVDTVGCEVVHFTPEACVRHLEMLSIWDFYKKKNFGTITKRRGLSIDYRPEAIYSDFNAFRYRVQ